MAVNVLIYEVFVKNNFSVNELMTAKEIAINAKSYVF